jgi:hypothetical protein
MDVYVENLSDFTHPTVQAQAERLCVGLSDRREFLEYIFLFVRDEILFGFPPKWDAVKASETLEYQIGYCNSKATLFAALCKAVGIPARIHTGLIDIQIMYGIFPSISFPLLPDTGGHSWVEVQIDSEWKPVDSYINDKKFYQAALKKLESSGRKTAYSISQERGESSCEFNFGEVGFVQMGAVVEDHGIWPDFSDYMRSDLYVGMSCIQLAVFPLMAYVCNRRVQEMRSKKICKGRE